MNISSPVGFFSRLSLCLDKCLIFALSREPVLWKQSSKGHPVLHWKTMGQQFCLVLKQLRIASFCKKWLTGEFVLFGELWARNHKGGHHYKHRTARDWVFGFLNWVLPVQSEEFGVPHKKESDSYAAPIWKSYRHQVGNKASFLSPCAAQSSQVFSWLKCFQEPLGGSAAILCRRAWESKLFSLLQSSLDPYTQVLILCS